jgi:biotin operon repressor
MKLPRSGASRAAVMAPFADGAEGRAAERDDMVGARSEWPWGRRVQHLNDLRCFHAVSRTRSIREAAESLNVAQSAVSRQIKNLEAQMGVPLFARHARGVRLTDAGEILAKYTRQTMLNLERTRSEIEDLRALRRGTSRCAPWREQLRGALMPPSWLGPRPRHSIS